MNKERIEGAINNIDSMIEMCVTDMAMGASYVRTQSSFTLDLFNLKGILESKLPKEIKSELIACEHCGAENTKAMHNRWHGNKCKTKK